MAATYKSNQTCRKSHRSIICSPCRFPLFHTNVLSHKGFCMNLCRRFSHICPGFQDLGTWHTLRKKMRISGCRLPEDVVFHPLSCAATVTSSDLPNQNGLCVLQRSKTYNVEREKNIPKFWTLRKVFFGKDHGNVALMAVLYTGLLWLDDSETYSPHMMPLTSSCGPTILTKMKHVSSLCRLVLNKVEYIFHKSRIVPLGAEWNFSTAVQTKSILSHLLKNLGHRTALCVQPETFSDLVHGESLPVKHKWIGIIP